MSDDTLPPAPCPLDHRTYVQLVVGRATDVLAARLDAMDKALVVQTGELARRLDLLNHAHQEAVAERARFVTHEMFNVHLTQFERFRDFTLDTLAHHRGRDAIVAFVVGLGASALVGILIALISVWWSR